MLKKFLQYGFAAVLIVCFCAIPASGAAASSKGAATSYQGSALRYYRDLSLTLLQPYLEKDVDHYYQKYFTQSPLIAPYDEHIVSIAGSVNGQSGCRITVQVEPYFGPHVGIGEDRITFAIDVAAQVKTTKFAHLKSIALPSNLKSLARSEWLPKTK